ncbi:type I-F CRISPR-associated helicase Cas3 [Enterobacteriaceae bacterium BIT-l23]|uniref:type I-F CRISPR-associated helicase Cas3f n=1 Tax=Jejubacter sp. L23 TaxID=3092086 RepID=UPI00158575B7|nr:type I-F CRISPR-associated helicase Cas3 [Enterobacteriaceae bacterium BIT-l23]
MNILLISQCTKGAREESCRILDRFAERTGSAAWQTAITLEGLNTLRKLLRKTARRNTAVACHWIKQGGQTELLWIVGNLRRFNAQGRVPTHRSEQDILRRGAEHHWHSAESIALLAALAALFHDFGKAGKCFQDGLTKQGKPRFQPYRHEWLSVRLFQAFVGDLSDEQWLAKLGDIDSREEKALLAALKKDSLTYSSSPLCSLPPLAQTVAWLILSHHRIPQLQYGAGPDLQYSAGWLERQLNADWNSRNHRDERWKEKDFTAVWTFPKGTPLRSRTWREKARQIVRRATQARALHGFGTLDQLFTCHLARLSLMLADHHYSAQQPWQGWQDERYAVWANSDRASGTLKQKLDEHLAGVSHHALLLGRSLPWVRRSLPAIARHKTFRERACGRFGWQNRAWDLALTLRERSAEQGFFGINMASTGCGKTFANARIMYALSSEQEGCRFSVALGLRTLTLQTGDALRSRLKLESDDLAVLTGSPAVQELNSTQVEDDCSSASAEEVLEDHQYVHYDGSEVSGPLHQWLAGDSRLNRLVSAPVLVTTIDHLMPATEGVRGGRQIPAMLRLLTSDLVLDEPDDFDNDDLHAMCRLVNWAGMLGSRVLLSSATLTPAQCEALFTAYSHGRREYQKACGEPERAVKICCAWFDEYGAQAQEVSGQAIATGNQGYLDAHQQFAGRRARRLPDQPRLRFGKLAVIEPQVSAANAVIESVADTVYHQALALHGRHHQSHPEGKTVSLGLVRMANINPLVALARRLMAMSPPDDYCFHYCVYHSQHPLAVRSRIEKGLDAAFSRHDQQQLWRQPEIRTAIEEHPARHHLFIVLGTSVVEVGRDWDADWGIIEPSSMRSLIQFAGRIQRHRQEAPQTENLIVLNRNIRALKGISPAYCQPGFEKSGLLNSHDLRELMPEACWQTLNAIPRIVQPTAENTFAMLEHSRLRDELLGNDEGSEPVASRWWGAPVTWNGELQRRTPFRKSQPEQPFFLYTDDEDEAPDFCFLQQNGEPKRADGLKAVELTMALGVELWFDIDYQRTLLALAEQRQMEIKDVCLRYGEILLRSSKEQAEDDWLYHPGLGVFRQYD